MTTTPSAQQRTAYPHAMIVLALSLALTVLLNVFDPHTTGRLVGTGLIALAATGVVVRDVRSGTRDSWRFFPIVLTVISGAFFLLSAF